MADILTTDQRDTLAAFLRDQTAIPFAYGKADCGLYLADWVMAAKSVTDPAAAVRGTYSTKEGAAAALGTMGFLDFVGTCAAHADCPETDAPQDGDIGVIDMPWGLVGGVMTGGSWAFRTPRGIAWAKVSGKVVKAWRVFGA